MGSLPFQFLVGLVVRWCITVINRKIYNNLKVTQIARSNLSFRIDLWNNSQTCDTRWNILSLGKCLRANSLWHVYLGSVFRRTAWPYPGTTCPDFNKFSQNVFTCSSDASIPISLTTYNLDKLIYISSLFVL